MTRPPPPDGPGIDRLLAIMARLRDPEDGCPWDLEQSFATIAPHTIEEAYEVADAIARGDMADLKDELGDLLFQVVFYAQMAREAGDFDFEAVAEAISDKMIRRHPHVFGTDKVATAGDMSRRWEAHKAAEREQQAAAAGARPSALDGVIAGLPALTRALKLQKRAARVGFDWPTPPPILDKIAEETDELRRALDAGEAKERLEDELGDLLFAVANLARRLDLDPESALRRANGKFERRFRQMEADLEAAGQRAEDQTLEALEELWLRAKARER